jgi:Rab GDP dissociation inhibitor
VETDNPQIEIKPGLDLLGPILDKYFISKKLTKNSRFVSVTDLYVPIEDGTKDHCYISKSYDATSHFETTTDDVKDIYQRIMGKPLIVKEKLRPTQVIPLINLRLME